MTDRPPTVICDRCGQMVDSFASYRGTDRWWNGCFPCLNALRAHGITLRDIADPEGATIPVAPTRKT